MLAQSRRAADEGVRVPSGNSRDPAEKSALGRILIVDDEALIRWSVAETLGEHGYETIEAADAGSGIRAVAPGGRAVDAVLLDLRLPDCDDLRALAAIRRLAPHTPVILMTSYGTPELFHEARHLGAFAIVDKPFEMAAIGPLVDRALAARPH